MMSRAEFEAEGMALRSRLEQRRRRYLYYWFGGLLLGAGLLFCALLAPAAALSGWAALFGKTIPVTHPDIIAFRIFALLFAGGLVLSPLFSYRGERGLPIERAVWLRLLGLFGVFTPVAGGNIAAAEIRRAELCDTPPLLFAEEGASGEMNGVRVRFTVAALKIRETGHDRLVFKGLLLQCDLPQGRVPPAVAPEADARIAEKLALLAASSHALTGQPTHWDERLTYGAAALYERIKTLLLSRMGKGELPAEKEYRLRYGTALSLFRPGAPAEGDAIVSIYALKHMPHGLLAAVAAQGSPFTIGSLFSPALDEARLRFLYDLMCAADTITRRLTPT